MGDRKTIATQVDPDSQLYRDFQEYQDQFSNKSEAVREALRHGMADESVKREDLEQALRQSQAEAQVGSWESAALTSSFLLATIAIAVAVATILPLVPSFEGIATATILVGTSITVVFAVQKGVVERLERRFTAVSEPVEPFRPDGVSD